ncbi:MAG: amidase family protein, partial [Haloarculaceae archaeon]
PGPTRNPHDPDHTPGGSSSGSAAAVAAGTCPLAVGTQTVGSILRPAAFCGVVGFKPSFGRVPRAGVVPLSESVDHVGLFAQDLPGIERGAAVCVDDWTAPSGVDRPTLGVPAEEYLEQATEEGLERFESAVAALAAAGYEVRRTDALSDVEAVNRRHNRLVAAEAAAVHDEWLDRYGDRYAEETAELIMEGREVPTREVLAGRRSRGELRGRLAETAREHGVDVWVSPAAPGPPPRGIDTTGDPVMNLPWTHAGVPAVSVPAGRVDGLPVGLQCTAGFGADERLLAWGRGIAECLH